MKTRLLIFSFLIFLSLYLAGQPSLGFTEAVIIKKGGDSLKCLIEMLGGYEDVITYKMNQDDRERSLKTKEVSAIVTSFRVYENVQVGKKEKVLPLAVDGPIKFYKSSYLNSGGQTSGFFMYGKPFTSYVIKINDSCIEIREKNFKEILLKVLDGCEKVVQKLKDDSYKYAELEKAVEDYYNCKEPETPEEKYDPELLGNWKSDLSDQSTKDHFGKASITFDKGTILYLIVGDKNLQSISYGYKIREDSIISFDPESKATQIIKYKFDGDNKLILETNGIRSVFIRHKN